MHGNNSNNFNVSHSNQKDLVVKSDMAQSNFEQNEVLCRSLSVLPQTLLLNQQPPSSNIKEKMGETDAALSLKP
jgi:hypothetical protein